MHQDKLSAPQLRAIQLMLDGKPNFRVCKELEIATSTLWRWRQEPLFSEAYREAKQAVSEKTRELLQMASSRAIARLVELMEGDTLEVPSSIQYASARSILELHLRTLEIEKIEVLQESVEELRTIVNPMTVKRGLKAV